MSDSTNVAYVHEPLPDSRTHIRLLKILHGGFDQHVVCEMSPSVVVAFIDRPYFQRVWILQELFLASKMFFHFGDDDGRGDLPVTLSYLIERWVDLSGSSRFGNGKRA